MSDLLDITDVFTEAWCKQIDELTILDGIEMWHIKSPKPFSENIKRKLQNADTKLVDCIIRTKDVNYIGKVIYLSSDFMFYLSKKEYNK